MTPGALRRRINRLPADTPRYGDLEAALGEGAGFNGAWYRSQKEHWQGWLREYDGPGAYGRAEGGKRSAEFVYNHIQCAPMLFWLAEALNVLEPDLEAAFAAVLAAPSRNASQCAALRRVIPWSDIEAALVETETRIDRIRRLLSMG